MSRPFDQLDITSPESTRQSAVGVVLEWLNRRIPFLQAQLDEWDKKPDSMERRMFQEELRKQIADATLKQSTVKQQSEAPVLPVDPQTPIGHSVHANRLTSDVKGIVALKVIAPVTDGPDPAVGHAFVTGMERMLSKSAKIASHFEKLFGGEASIKFDEKAESAYFVAKDKQIIMPGKKGKVDNPDARAQDLVDAFLFESCNVERGADYVELNEKFLADLDSKPKSFSQFAQDKARIECEATTKQTQLLFDLLDEGGELAPAGKRNLLATTGLVMNHASEKGLKDVLGRVPVDPTDLKQFNAFMVELKQFSAESAEAETLLPDQKAKAKEELAKKGLALDKAADQFLKKHSDFMRRTLPLIDTDPGLGQAVLNNFMNTRHNVNKAKPTDKGNLTTKDMYAFEQMESPKPQELIKMMKTAVIPPGGNKGADNWQSIDNNWPGIEQWMDDTLRHFELDEESVNARQQVLVDIIDKLEAEYPEAKGKLGAVFGFTPEMKEVAKARFDAMVKSKKTEWDKVKDKFLPPQKGWTGKLPIPLQEVATQLPQMKARKGSAEAADLGRLEQVTSAPQGKPGCRAVPNADAGVNTSFKVEAPGTEGGKGETVALFKPKSSFSGTEKAAQCFKKPGAKEAREVACSAWNQLCGGLGDYPVTAPAEFDGQKGSLMAWRHGAQEYGDLKPEKQKELVETVDTDDAQDLMALHIATLQCDAENSRNVMFTMQDGHMKPFAIDGGLSAPETIQAFDLKAPCWSTWPQADKPWTPAQQAKLKKIDVDAAGKALTTHMSGSAVDALEDESILRMKCSTQALIIAAHTPDMTPKLTWTIIQQLELQIHEAQEKVKKGGVDFFDEFKKIVEAKIRQFALASKEVNFKSGSEANQDFAVKDEDFKKLGKQTGTQDPLQTLKAMEDLAAEKKATALAGPLAQIRSVLEGGQTPSKALLQELTKQVEALDGGGTFALLKNKDMVNLLRTLKKAVA
ncbi:MAG TPA: hypothetical protein VIN03_17770 [Roseateles sp.]